MLAFAGCPFLCPAYVICPYQELTGGLCWPGEPWPDPISFPALQQLSQPLRVSRGRGGVGL